MYTFINVYIWLNDVSYDFHPKLSDFMWVVEQHTNMHAVGVSKPYPKQMIHAMWINPPMQSRYGSYGPGPVF